MRFTLWILLLLTLASCSRSVGNADSVPEQRRSPEIDRTAEARAWADSVLATLSTEQMAAQLLMPCTYVRTDAYNLNAILDYVRQMGVGGIGFHKGTMQDMRLLTDTLHSLGGIPLFLAIDAETGLGMRLEGATSYPPNYRLTGADEAYMYDYGRTVGEESRSVGLNMVFGPVLDVVPSAETSWYMYRRSFGTDPERVALLAGAWARGLMDVGVMPVGKHFPGHGATRANSHETLPVIGSSRAVLEERDLLPFRRYIELGYPALMTAHVSVPALEPERIPADMSAPIMTDLLRKDLGFKGLVISDALNMGGFRTSDSDSVPGPVRALLAGVDILLAPDATRVTIDQIVTATARGTLPERVLRTHARRVLFYKALYLR